MKVNKKATKESGSVKKGKKQIYDVDLKFYDDTDEESYKRYKHRCYRNLILKSLLSFILGLFLAVMFRLLISGST